MNKLVKWETKAQNLHCLFRENLYECAPFPEDSRETLRLPLNNKQTEIIKKKKKNTVKIQQNRPCQKPTAVHLT
jgi:hypothetical protein